MQLIMFLDRSIKYQMTIFQQTRLIDSKGQPLLHHLYTTEDINHILILRCREYSDLKVMGALMGNHLGMGELLRNSLVQNIHVPVLLYPVCIENHLVGIKIVHHEDRIKVIFYDSLPSTHRENRIKDSLMPTLIEVFGKNVEWSAMKRPYVQPDGSSCGAYLIENIYNDLDSSNPRQHWTPESIRQSHVDLLMMHDPAYLGQISPMSGQKRKERDESVTPQYEPRKK